MRRILTTSRWWDRWMRHRQIMSDMNLNALCISKLFSSWEMRLRPSKRRLTSKVSTRMTRSLRARLKSSHMRDRSNNSNLNVMNSKKLWKLLHSRRNRSNKIRRRNQTPSSMNWLGSLLTTPCPYNKTRMRSKDYLKIIYSLERQ